MNLSVSYGERLGFTNLVLLPTPFGHIGMIVFQVFSYLCVLFCVFVFQY